MFIHFNDSFTRSYIRVIFKIGHKITKKKSNRKEKKKKKCEKVRFCYPNSTKLAFSSALQHEMLRFFATKYCLLKWKRLLINSRLV